MKNLSFLFSLHICFALCFTSCGDDATDNTTVTDFTIIPGEGINDLKIGDLGSQVEIELGSGYEAFINVGTSGNATYNYYNSSIGMDIIFGQHSSGDLDINTLPIKSFYMSDNFNGMTTEGIKIGSSEEEVISAYGEPDEIDFWAHVYYQGIIFSYDDNDNVQSITVLEI